MVLFNKTKYSFFLCQHVKREVNITLKINIKKSKLNSNYQIIYFYSRCLYNQFYKDGECLGNVI